MHSTSKAARTKLAAILKLHTSTKVARQLNVNESSIHAYLETTTTSQANLRDFLLIEHFALLPEPEQATLLTEIPTTTTKPRRRSYFDRIMNGLACLNIRNIGAAKRSNSI